MSSEWLDTTIGEQLTLQRGFDITKATQEPGAVPVISSGGTNSFHSTAMVEGPGVVLGRKGIVGSVYFVREAYWPHDTTLWIKDFHGNDELFAYYFFLAKAKDLAQLDVGSANPTLNRNHVHPIRVQFPPLCEQRLIGRILGALDNRISLLRETNATLEAIAQTLFKSWFVDFDPVRAKAEGRQPEGMDPATAALFPDNFVGTEGGSVPYGWRIGHVGEIAEVIDCLHSKKPELTQSGYPFLQLSNIRDDGLLDTSEVACISEEDYRKWISRLEATEGDCVITNVGRVGAVAQIPEGFRAAMGRNMTAIRLKEKFPYPTYLIELLQSQWMRAEINTKTDVGTILNALNVRSIPMLRCPIAPKVINARFEELCRPIRAAMEANLRRANSLAALRDTLLPRLISGQLRLPEAEAVIESVMSERTAHV